MGVCPIRRTYRTVPIQETEDYFTKCKSELINRLKQLHKLNLICNRKIENLIFDKKNDEAIYLKSKQLKLKDHSKLIQEFLRKLDDENENIKENLSRCAYTEDILIVIIEREKEICIEKITESLEKGVFEDLGVDETQIESENNEKMQEVLIRLKIQTNRIENLNKDSFFQRRIYVKESSLESI